MAALIGKNRRPKFDLHLQIYDLNNVPLVSGSSFIKWHLTHSIHAEHRGRTPKCPIANHRVEYGFTKLVPGIRISIDKNNCLSDCPIEFEVLQEFQVAEKITLGNVKLNLSEYVEESEAFVKDAALSPIKRRNSLGVPLGGNVATAAAKSGLPDDECVEEGIVRRHLMQDSKVNSTLRIGILMVQVDGDRNYSSPPLRTAPTFGVIAGLMAPDQVEDEAGPIPSVAKSREYSEIQDLYRRTLAASWHRQPNELPADECIEDIFAGGDGWGTHRHRDTDLDSDRLIEDGEMRSGATLRPVDLRRMAQHRRQRSGGHHHHHRRTHSASSEQSTSTVVGHSGSTPKRTSRQGRDGSRDARDEDPNRSRSGSLISLTSTLRDDSSMRDTGMKRMKEFQEADLREDLVAWKLPADVSA